MEYSENFNFALPSSSNDIDIADINDISNNFRIIDAQVVKKEEGKGLSTNDFSNTDKNKLNAAITFNDIVEIIKNSKPMLITFNNSDFDNSDSQQLPIEISFKLNQSRIILIATFDVSRLNFRISDGSDYSIYKVLIEGEPFDLSMLDEYIKSMETLESDYGEVWIVEGSQYAYMHEYSFGNVDNANTVFAELSEMGLNGFQLLVNNYNQITAKEV